MRITIFSQPKASSAETEQPAKLGNFIPPPTKRWTLRKHLTVDSLEKKGVLPEVLFVLLAGLPVLDQPDLPKQEDRTAESAFSLTPGNNTSFRIQRDPVAGGAELITLFGKLQDPASNNSRLDVPIVSVLRDTLGDSGPDTERLRYVWILTSTPPTPLQRLASAFSFLCFRTGTKHHSNRIPTPALDLAAPAKSVLPGLLGKGLQSTEFDPLGVIVRSSTRSYRGNSSDYKKLHLYQALGALDGLERSEEGRDILPDSQLREIYSRLSLSDRTFGGLVRENKLARFYGRETSRRHETLGHNWELLRQRAEQAGLYFQPLSLPDAAPTQALLWIAREDLERRENQRFDRQFLNIANPWTDPRLEHWTGYTQVQYLDAENRSVTADAPGARPVEMIPLAFYSLDHPRAPLLLADFRNTLKPKRGELVRHGATSVLTGVFGITRFGSWPFFVGDSALTFVQARHGAAVDRSARLEAYSQTREFLAVDSTLDPKLKTELLHHLDHLALNPLENGISTEATVANEQYSALLRYAGSNEGEAKLERDRRKELDSYTRSGVRRFLASIGRRLSGNPSIDSENPNPQLRVQLAAYRSAAYHMRFLEQVLASGPRPEVAWDRSAISESIEALSSGDAVSASAPANPRAARLIARVFSGSSDPELRFSCLRALSRLNVEEAHNELWRLSQNRSTDDSWRAVCLLYFRGHTTTTVPVGSVAGLGGGQ
jgi:hypothetical protein